MAPTSLIPLVLTTHGGVPLTAFNVLHAAVLLLQVFYRGDWQGKIRQIKSRWQSTVRWCYESTAAWSFRGVLRHPYLCCALISVWLLYKHRRVKEFMNNWFRARILFLLDKFTTCETGRLGVRTDSGVRILEWITHLYLANNFPIKVHLTVPKAKYIPWGQGLRWSQICNVWRTI